MAPSSKQNGSWDSIHVFEAQDRARRAHYKLTSTVILNLGTDSESLGNMDLSGNMVRQVEVDMPVDDESSHVANIGRMVEDMELKMRNLLRKLICRWEIGVLIWFQRRFTSARRRMLLVIYEVGYSSRLFLVANIIQA